MPILAETVLRGMGHLEDNSTWTFYVLRSLFGFSESAKGLISLWLSLQTYLRLNVYVNAQTKVQ